MSGQPLVWICLLFSLLPAEIRSRGLRARIHRVNVPETYMESSYPNSPPASDLSATISNQILPEDAPKIWGSATHKDPSTKLSVMFLYENSNTPPMVKAWKRRSRGRRHANKGGARAHVHLMRVGCVLGTCQVQNLSHRLYQLIGQNGREDFSPINPRSPHSYG